MTLENLRKEIFERTAPRKFPITKNFCRTLFVVAEPSLEPLKKWYQKRFPIIDEDVKKIYPWAILSEDEDTNEKIIRRIVREAFHTDTHSTLRQKGYAIIDVLSQVVIIADLSKPGSAQKIENIFDKLHNAIISARSTDIDIHWIGIFQLRKYTHEQNEENWKTSADELKKTLEFARRNFSRIFLIDYSGKAGTFIDSDEDFHTLMGHICYLLRKRPVEIYERTMSVDEYVMWLRSSSPEEDEVAGFSGISLLVPIDEIVETALVSKGADVLETALFGEHDEKRAKLYFDTILEKFSLAERKTFFPMLTDDENFPLLNPIADIPNWNPKEPYKYIILVDYIEKHLEDVADKNAEIMNGIADTLLLEYKYNLKDTLDAIISDEVGGMAIARFFLKMLAEHIEKIQGEKKYSAKAQDGNISKKIAELRKYMNKGLRLGNLITRGVFASFVWFLAMIHILGIPSGVILGAEFFVGFMIIFLLRWHFYKTRAENKTREIFEKISAKWDAMMKDKIENSTDRFLDGAREIIDDYTTEVLNAEGRLKEVIEFMREKYVPEAPEKSTFWRYVVEDRSEYEKFFELLKIPDIKNAAKQFLKNSDLLSFWQSASIPAEKNQNLWEWRIFEQSAKKLFPYANPLLNLSVCDIIGKDKEYTKNMAELLLQNSKPFLILNAGVQPEGANAVLEIPEECAKISQSFSDEIKKHTEHFALADSLSPYRISFLAVLDNVKSEWLNIWREGKLHTD